MCEKGAHGVRHLLELVWAVSQVLPRLEPNGHAVALRIPITRVDESAFCRASQKMLAAFVIGIRGCAAGRVALYIHLPAASMPDFPAIQAPDLGGQQTGCAEGIARYFTREMPGQKGKTDARSAHRKGK